MTRELTGRHVFFITAGAFAVVIAANMAMLYASVTTFPGLVVDNSYVASQSFDARAEAQRALGWTVAAGYEDGAVALALTGRDDQPVEATILSAEIGRPTLAASPLLLDFDPVLGRFSGPADLAPGLWQLDLTAEASDGTVYEAHIDLYVPKAAP